MSQSTPTTITIAVRSKHYEDYDDSLLAAADHVRAALGIAGWTVDERWDDAREAILLTVPAWAVTDAALADCGAKVYGTTYLLVSDHSGPCSVVAEYATLDDAIEAARTMDTDLAPTDGEDLLGYDGSGDRDDRGLLAAAEAAGWRVVAAAPAGEYWTVLSGGA